MTDIPTNETRASRFAACVSYDGAFFSGWQRQAGTRTVQEAVEQALSFVANHRVGVACAGRTDAGVHATGQIVHFDSAAPRALHGWLRGGNTQLPEGVAIYWVRPVTADFHARFRARRRRYRYIILNQPVRPALFRRQVSWEYRQLDAGRMAEAASCLLGRHDFSAFRAAACQSRNPVKTLYRLEIGALERWIWLDLEADGFLHHMVRNIAGVLIRIGCGERDVGWCETVLDSRDRTRGGVTAPPGGLYLTGVDYDHRYGLPEPPPAPRFW
ncbi:MAG: tRNA pseudouridine(38-40) synthase TruA [Proteobacteria bacterium]|nr:MAG: tRNA pseudouridine(38-40) synthase TruA [Pseudomonadota bacterium]